MKIARKTKKDLEQTLYAYSEEQGVPLKEAREDLKGFMKGATSLLVSEALNQDPLNLVKNNENLQSLIQEAQNRFSAGLSHFHQGKK